jgi:hypothetical protein
VVSEPPTSGGTFDIATDEGELHGGDGTGVEVTHRLHHGGVITDVERR